MRLHFPRPTASFLATMSGCIVLCFLSAQVPAYAQSFTATLQGAVTDTSGSAVPNAHVSLLNEATNVKQQEKLTDSRGGYLFTLLPPGSYRMTVEMPGFQISVHSGLVLQVQQQAEVDVVLHIGEVSTTVLVAGEAPRHDAVSATLGRVVESRSLQSMPLVSRNILDLANLAPGVVGSPGG